MHLAMQRMGSLKKERNYPYFVIVAESKEHAEELMEEYLSEENP